MSDLLGKSTEVPNLIRLQLFGSIAVLLGLLVFVISGIYLAIAYVFAGIAIVDKPQSFVGALNSIRRLVTPHWFDVTLFLLAVVGVVALRYLACLVGGFVSIPVGFCTIDSAYQHILCVAGKAIQNEDLMP